MLFSLRSSLGKHRSTRLGGKRRVQELEKKGKQPEEQDKLSEKQDKAPEAAAPKRTVFAWRSLRRYLSAGGLSASVFGAVAGIFLLVSAVATSVSNEKLIIDKVELPTSLVDAGISSDRVGLSLQAALERLVGHGATPQAPSVRKLTGDKLALRNPLSTLRSNAVEVSVAGNVFAADRIAFWLLSKWPGADRQSMVTVRVSEATEGALDVHMSLKHSDDSAVMQRTPFPARAMLLDDAAPPMQRLALQILLGANPGRAISELLERDRNACQCLSDETLAAFHSQFHDLSAYRLFSLLWQASTIVTGVDAGDLVYTGQRGDFARLVARARHDFPQAPWYVLSFVEGTALGRCKNLDRELEELAHSSLDRQSLAASLPIYMAQCITTNRDAETFARVLNDGFLDRFWWWQARNDALALAVNVAQADIPATKSNEMTAIQESAMAYLRRQWKDQPRYIEHLERQATSQSQDLAEVYSGVEASIRESFGPDCPLTQQSSGSLYGGTCTQSFAKGARVAPSLPIGVISLTHAEIDPSVFLRLCTLRQIEDFGDARSAFCMGEALFAQNDAYGAVAWFKRALASLDAQVGSSQSSRAIEDIQKIKQLLWWARFHLGMTKAELQATLKSDPDGKFFFESLTRWRMTMLCQAKEGETPLEVRNGVQEGHTWQFARLGREAISRGDTMEGRDYAAILLRHIRFFPDPDPVEQVEQPAFEAFMLIGLSRLAEGRFDDAQVALTKALAMRPYSAEASITLNLAKQGKSHPNDRKVCTPILDRYPDIAETQGLVAQLKALDEKPDPQPPLIQASGRKKR